MKMIKSLIAILVILLLGFSSEAFSIPAPLKLEDVMSMANVVVEGRMTQVKHQNTIVTRCDTKQEVSAQIEVKKIIKGSPPPTISFHYMAVTLSSDPVCGVGRQWFYLSETDEQTFYLFCDSLFSCTPVNQGRLIN